ncbi:MAG: BlaI/MecI/CopY family transcriptional regulator [Saprospiraceae bacterium]
MQALTKKEEEIMQLFWRQGKAFVKEIRAALPKPLPNINTVSTVVRRLVDKGYLAYEDFGPIYRYYAIIDKEAYSRQFLAPKLANVFDDSYKNVVAFFAKEEKISKADLEEIIRLIEQNKED